MEEAIAGVFPQKPQYRDMMLSLKAMGPVSCREEASDGGSGFFAVL